MFFPLAVIVLVATSMSPRPAAAGGTEVQIVTRDGASIGATFFAGAPGPAVVIFRNCDAERASVTDLAVALQARGLSTLAYDYRPGLAPGRDYEQTRLVDMEDVHDWLARQPGVTSTRLAAIGGSCGVQAALVFARRYAPDVRAAIVMSGGVNEELHAFVRTAPHLAILGIGSRPEGAPELIDDITRASPHPATRRLMLENRRHGTFILDDPALRANALAWLTAQLGVTP
ncbi:MAG: hypothetical protein ABI634_16340 [Acidobacteriota bacterium]